MRNAIYRSLPALLLILGSITSLAQSMNSGDIRGSVKDGSGALIPEVKVTVLNVDTGVSKIYVTNQDGLYDTSSIVTGIYTVTFAKNGFEKLVRGPITLQVGITTVDAQLPVGSVTQQVAVTSDVPLLETESGEQATTWNSKTLDEMPQVASAQGQDWESFTILLPGTTGTANVGSTTPQQWGASNGNLPYSNVLEDGASTSLGGSSIGSPAIMDTVAELQVSTANFSAQYGTGGMIFNQITKGGTNKFHGSAYDYIQNDALNAAEYGFGNEVPVPFIRFHDFGGSVGGPVLKNKIFFYFGYEQIVNHGSASNSTYTTPTTAIMSGDFSSINRTLYDPTTQVIAKDSQGNLYPVRKSFQDEYGCNCIPQSHFDSVAANAQQYYPTPSNHLSGGRFVTPVVNVNGIQTNNFFSSLPQSTPYRKFFGRLDYDLASNNRLSMSTTKNDTPVQYPSAFTECPLGCEAGDVDNVNAQITDVWTVNPHLINEARMGYTWQGNYFNDYALDQGYAAKLGWKFAKADDFPNIGLSSYQGLGPAINATESEHVFDPSDVVTMIRGKHIIHFGGEMLIYREDSTQWGDTNAGSLAFSGQYTQHWSVNGNGVASPDVSTGLDYADFLLGLAQNWGALVQPEYGGRFKTPQLFVQDDYKVLPNLTVNLGLRYQMTRGWSEVHGNEDSFDRTVINPATNTPGAMWYGTTHANGRSALMAGTNTFMPRVGFAWLLRPDTTLHGGFGLYSYPMTLDINGTVEPGGIGGPFGDSGSASDSTNGVTPLVKLDGDGTFIAGPTAGQTGTQPTTTPLHYTSFATTPDAYNGQAVGYYQYHTPVPRSYQWNLALQKMLSRNLMAELAYVGSHGFDLNYLTDLDQVPKSKLSPSDSQYRPYPNYTSIAGSTNNAISNYNSLQASITKRMSNGLSFSANYVWSHFLDEQDSAARGRRQSGQWGFQIADDPSADYSNSNFDVRNAFKAYGVYQLPVGIGRRYLNGNRLLDAAIGGWQVSGTLVLLTGNPFSVFSNQNTYALVGTAYPNWSGINPTPKHRSIHEWYNPEAFVAPANGTFGNVRRNSLYGPGVNQVNLSGGKVFSLPWEGVKLQIRCDAVNAFNHASFGVPNQNLSSTNSAGEYIDNTNITWTTVSGRSVQLGAHLSF